MQAERDDHGADSAEEDEDELPLLVVKRAPVLVQGLVPIATIPTIPLLATAPPDPLSGTGGIRRHIIKKPTESNSNSNSGPLETTTSSTSSIVLPAMVKEEVAVDWLMEPRLVSDDIEMKGVVANGTDVKMEEEEESALLEEEVIDGFSILTFKSYEDLEVSGDGFGCCCDCIEFPNGLLGYCDMGTLFIQSYFDQGGE